MRFILKNNFKKSTFLCVFEHRSILKNQQTGSYKKDNLPVHSYTVFPALQRDSVRLVQ